MKKLFLISSILVSGLIYSQKGLPDKYPGPNTTYPLPQLVEEVKRTGNEVIIPYKRYKLTNGLNVIVHEDHSDPIVYVDVTYHVGSAREQQGRSGFAHFFEHMMFQGSKHVGDDQHFKIINEAGGIMNGTTNTDRTNYFEVCPSNQLEKMLWLEADRMGFLLDSVTQKKFEIQRATVKNERGQRYDNAPYGLVQEKIGEALYPQGHPYSWTTIGYLEDLNRVDVNDLKRFYMRWYGPNNAVLTIAGDVKAEDVLHLVQKYFGSINVGPAVKTQTVAPVKLTANRYISYEDNVKFPLINMVFPTVKADDKDEAALDVLGNLLSQTQSSPLYKTFIEAKKANSAGSFQFARELAGQMVISVRANPGTLLAETEKEIKKSLDDWSKKGISDDDLIKYKAQYQSHIYNRLGTVQGKGSTLAANFTMRGSANLISKDLAKHLAVTKADVMRVYNTYIKNKPSVILSCLPKGKAELKPKPDNWKMNDRKVEKESTEYKNLNYTLPLDNFNRSEMPKAGAAMHAKTPDFFTDKINGVPFIGVSEDEIPKVDIVLNFKAGHLYEAKEKAGLSLLTAQMLGKSSLKTTKEELENRCDRLGADVVFYSQQENFSIYIEAPKQNMVEVMKIVEEQFFEPKFDTTEFKLLKKQSIDRILQGKTNAGALASEAFAKILYGSENILAYPAEGTIETIKNITVDDVKYFYEKLNSSMLSIAVSGDITKEEVLKELAFVNKIKGGTPLKTNNTPIPVIEKTKIYFVDKKDAAQSEIRIGYIALPYDYNGDFYKCEIMNYSFCGAFNSRINYLLREIKGWSYGVKSEFEGTKLPGPYTIHGGFKANTTDSTLVEIFKEFKKYYEGGITNEELEFTKHAIAQHDALNYESPRQRLSYIINILENNLPKDYVSEQVKILDEMNKEQVNEHIKKYLPYNKMVVVVVGDKATNFEKVKSLGFEVVEYNLSDK